ncbi:hypothetical protein [Brevibacillus reuszeri]|uniref:hypothetical protein n=1 Tax=Brevibacillus reuszeri TaxID=54915 RepID=UPI0028A282DE|nr:hypothetical protein [Brevibacillus reuszeri]
MRVFLAYLLLVSVFLWGCTPSQQIDDVASFSPQNKGEYLLFHFMSPFEDEGYILEVDAKGEVKHKLTIKDDHFAPSDVFYNLNNYYFTSGAYSNDFKVMEYNPETRKISLIDTNQNKYIEKYYKDEQSEYIITTLDKNDNNEICDIKKNKCMSIGDGYSAHTLTTLDNFVIVLGAKDGNSSIVKKYNRDFEFLEEIKMENTPAYFTYTSEDQKLYLFMKNGDIVDIDSNLKIKTYPINLTSISNNIKEVKYQKNVMLDPKRILVDLEIKADSKTNMIAEISFDNTGPSFEIISKGTDEDILNVDYTSGEVFTRSSDGKNAVIYVRDTEKLELLHRLVLTNKDAIYFVDNIKQ